MHTRANITPRAVKAKMTPVAAQGTTRMVVFGGSGMPSAEDGSLRGCACTSYSGHTTLGTDLETPIPLSGLLETQSQY